MEKAGAAFNEAGFHDVKPVSAAFKKAPQSWI